MPVVIHIISLADGRPSEYDGQYLHSYDIEGRDGRGNFNVTRFKALALKFPNHAKAFEVWKTQSKTRPLRPDGQPNRPLTAFTIEIVEV